jgi:hypothetical protein
MRYEVKYDGWDDDAGREFCRGEYLGGHSHGSADAGHVAYCDTPTFAYEQQSPRIQRLEARLAEICPDWPRVRDDLMEWWLCAPKSFRFLERKLWNVGRGVGRVFDAERKGAYEPVPGFLRCEDTYPNHDEAAPWWRAFLQALDAWWQGNPMNGAVADDVRRRLGKPTDLKRWLVRLYARRLRRLEENGEQFSQLVRTDHTHKRGTRPLHAR